MKKTLKSILSITLAFIIMLSVSVIGLSVSAAKTLYAPTNVKIQNSGTGFYIKWNKAANASGYRVYYKTAETDWAYSGTNTNSISLEELEYGKLYYIQVQTLGSNNATGNYTKVTSMTHVRGTALENAEYKAENNEETTDLDRTITLEWDKADGANGYAIAKYKEGNFVGYFYTTDTNYTDTAIVAGSQYAYQINPYYSNGKSAAYAYWSNIKVLTTFLKTKIKEIDNSPYTSPANININWDRVDGAKGYILSYLCSKGDNLEDVFSEITTSSTYYNIKFPPKDAYYSFWVRPVNGAIIGPYSNPALYKVESLGTPKTINIESTYAGMTINWDEVDKATGYEVAFKRLTDTAWNHRITTFPTYTVPNPTPGAKYYVQIRALCEPINNKENKYVEGDYSVPANSHDIKPLGVPKITGIDSTYDKITFKWSEADGATAYDIAFRRENVDTEEVWHHKTTTDTTLSVDNPTPGATYTVKVCAVRGNNNGEYSQTSSKEIPVLETPVITNINATVYQLSINWGAVDDATGYQVAFKRSTDKAWNYRTTTNPTYVVPNPTKGTTYYIQVRSLYGSAVSKYTPVNTQIIPEKDPYEGLTYYEAGETVTVTHPAESELVWIVDEPAHQETVTEPIATVYNVLEKGHYEVKIIKESWTEQVEIKESGWYRTVIHPAETVQVKIIDKAGYTYEEPVYDYVYHAICNTCGADITDDPVAHTKVHTLAHEGGSWSDVPKYEQVSTKTVTVPEQSHYETRTIKAAWSEYEIVREVA